MQKLYPNKIRVFRKEKGLRQVDLAKELGIFQSEVSDLETGKRKPNIYFAKKIAKVLGKDINEIFPS
jgi:putative transcriptional regulator